MDSTDAVTPPSHRSKGRLLRNRPPPCLSPPFDEDSSDNAHHVTPPLAAESPVSPPSYVAIHASNHAPLQELHLLSRSPARRQRSLVLAQAENIDPASIPRRKAKNRAAAAVAAASNMGLMGCASPRNVRRARRRLDKEVIREERQLDAFEDDVVKVRRRRQGKTAHSRMEEKTTLVPALPPPAPSSAVFINGRKEQSALDALKYVILELIMWKDAAKASLWFGLGSLCIISTCFSRDLSFCFISAASNLGLLILALAFFCDSVSQRRQEKARKVLRFTEDDIQHAARLVLPAVNAAIGTAQEVFSGEPSMTLKVAPILLFAAKYGHHITLWRILATGFFLSFTVPKLYSSHSTQILTQVDKMERSALEAWSGCRHKRVLAILLGTALWNLFGVKIRIIAAFICLVVLRYHCERYPGRNGGVPEGGVDRSEQQYDEEGTTTRQDGGRTQPKRPRTDFAVEDDEETQN